MNERGLKISLGQKGIYHKPPKVSIIIKKLLNSISRAERIFRDMKMQNKLIVSFFILSFIPLVISGVFSVNSSGTNIKKKISTYSLQLLGQVNQNISTSILKVKNYSDDIIGSQDMHNRLINYKTAGDADKTSIRTDYARMMQLKFLNTENVDDVFMVFMNDESENQYDTTHVRIQYRWGKEELSRIMKLNGDEENISNLTMSLQNIGGADEKELVIGRIIRNISTSKVLGHLLIAINNNYLRDIYKDIDIGEGADIFIIDPDGVVISSNNPQIAIGDQFSEHKLLEQIKYDNKPDGGTFSLKINKKDKLIAYSPMKIVNWYVVSTIPYSYLNSEAREFSYKIAFFTIAILILSFIVSFIISHSISSPLQKLEKNMGEFGEGKINSLVEVDREDEIGHLQKSFNSMSADIKELLNKIEEENRLRRMMELKVLEYQINPHFLYNTLDSINWMAQKAGQGEISTIVTTLARFFRLSLSKSKGTYTIKNEIEHVQNYLIISKFRYKDCFEFYVDVDPVILNYESLKIILQPLAENAIKHGINKSRNDGVINIIGRKEGEVIILEVADNGRGIEKDRIEYLNNAINDINEISNVESGFGLQNVHQRIRLNFGEAYGLHLDSQPGQGTTVKVKFPAVLL